MNGRFRLVVAAIVAGFLPVAACSLGTSAGDDVVVGHGVDRFPSESLVDWVSYADHVSYFTVLDETALPWGEHEIAHGEGMVGRVVDVRIDATLWTHASSSAIADKVTYQTDGWALQDGKELPFVLEGGTRVEVGERYLAAWVHTAEDGWFPLATSTIMPVDTSGRPGRSEHGNHQPANDALVGQSPTAITAMLDSTRPDPAAAAYFDLEPEPRYNAVLLSQLPNRPGFVKAAIGNANGSFGYIKEDDWAALKQSDAVTNAIPFYNQDGAPEGSFTMADGQVLAEE